MQCPFCKANNDKVIDSRSGESNRAIRRRRQCLECDKRFTTYERVESTVRVTVIKKDGSRVPYDRNKILKGLQKACYKRPVSDQALQVVVDKVEEQILANYQREVPSKFIGEQTAGLLRDVDEVGYVRFASVYRQFQDAGEFIDEAREVMGRDRQVMPGQQKIFEEDRSKDKDN